MSNGVFEIEERLARWSYYKISLCAGNLGWPPKNLIVNLGQGTCAQYPTTGVCLILKFDNSQQTDSWIKNMGRVYPHLEEALLAYYTCKLPTSHTAKLLGVSKRTLLQRVHEAKLWLCGRLNALLEAQSSGHG